MSAPEVAAPRLIAAKRESTCWSCGGPISEGAAIYWHRHAVRGANGQMRSPVWHSACPAPAAYVEPGTSQPPPAVVKVSPVCDVIPSAGGSELIEDESEDINEDDEDTDDTVEPEAPPRPARRSKPQPAADDALGQLARALGPLMPRVAPSIDRDAVARIVREAVGQLETRLEQLTAQPRDTDDVRRAAYDGTRTAIIDAQDAGADTSKLPVPLPIPTLDPLYQPTTTGTRIAYALRTGRPFIVSGPSGSGKTYPVRMEVARQMRPIVELSAGDGIGYSQLVGSPTLERDAAGGVITGFRPGALLQAMQGGAVFLLDEIDQLPRPLLALLYGVLEPGRVPTLYVPELGTTIVAQAGFMLAATGNTIRDTTGGYSGERPSYALLNRMLAIPADYLSLDEERAIFERVGLPQREAHAVAAALAGLRRSYASGSLTIAPSTRMGVQLSRAVLGQGPDGGAADAGNAIGHSEAWTLYALGALPSEEAASALLTIQAAYSATGATLG